MKNDDPKRLIEEWTGRRNWFDRFSIVLLAVSVAGFCWIAYEIAQAVLRKPHHHEHENHSRNR